MSLVAGVDSHKDSLSIVVIDAVGKEIDRFHIGNETAGFETALKRVRRAARLYGALKVPARMVASSQTTYSVQMR